VIISQIETGMNGGSDVYSRILTSNPVPPLFLRFHAVRPVTHIPFPSLKRFIYSHFHNRTPLSFRFSAFEVTLSGFAGGEYLPLPASKGPAFPSLLTLDGYPTSPAIYAQGQRCSLNIQETPESQTLERSRDLALICGRSASLKSTHGALLRRIM